MASSSALQLVKRFRSREIAKALPGWENPAEPKLGLQNPFLPWFNAQSKRWQPPLYSRRRQAQLIKAAKLTGTVHLLPPGPKFIPQPRYSAVLSALEDVEVQWHGEMKEKQVAGADIGARLYAGKKRMFKGHKWERELVKRRKQINIRLRDMPKRIKRFKTVYKRTRPYALGKIIHGKEKVGI